MNSKIVVIILFNLFIFNAYSQETESLSNKKIINASELKQLKKTYPNLKTSYIIENRNVLNAKEFSDISNNYGPLDYKYICYQDQTTRNITIQYIKLSKEERKQKEQELEDRFEALKRDNKNAKDKLDGTIIDELNLVDMSNKTHTLATLKGKVIVLNFWFTKCKPCVAEFPELNDLKAHFKNEPVEFFAVTFNKKTTLSPFLKKHKLDFTVIHTNSQLIKKFGIPYYPFFIIIDKDGKIEYLNDFLSFNMVSKLNKKIKKLL